MTGSSPSIGFKFKMVLNGDAKGFFSSAGTFDRNGLALGDERIPHEQLHLARVAEPRVVIGLGQTFAPTAAFQQYVMQGNLIVFEITSGDAKLLGRAINQAASARLAEIHRRELTGEGKAEAFRAVKCPNCRATNDLSGLDPTPIIQCEHCDSLFQDGKGLVTSGDTYRTCPECGMFDRVQTHTEFYFYFLLVVYGFRHGKQTLCDNCAASLANKMLLANFLFLLGLPNALMVQFRVRTGRDARLADLPKANALASAGNPGEADPLYRAMLGRMPKHPGLLFNQALAHFQGNDADTGWEHLKACLEACGNFRPALEFVAKVKQNVEAAED